MAIMDWVILAVVLISALISLKRGFVRELLSLATWAGALVVAVMFSERLSLWLAGLIATESWRIAAAFALLFILTLIVGAMLGHLLGELIRMTGLSTLDRGLGVVFGGLRGVLIVVALLAVGRLLALESFWEGSLVTPWLEPLVNWAGEYVHTASARVFDVSKP